MTLSMVVNPVSLFFLMIVAGSARAEDDIIIGYTSTGGILAGLFVPPEGGFFDKHAIPSNLVLTPSGARSAHAISAGNRAYAEGENGSS